MKESVHACNETVLHSENTYSTLIFKVCLILKTLLWLRYAWYWRPYCDWGMLDTEDLTVTEVCLILKTLLWLKCRTAIKELFLYFNLCLSVMLDSLLCSFTFISILTSTIVAIKIFPFFFSSLSLSKIWSYHSINFEVSVLMSIFSLNMVMHQHIKQVHQWSNLISISPCHIFLKKHKAKH
jgi:hypothetical protein